MACALMTVSCGASSNSDGDCPLPTPTSSPLARGQSTQLVVHLARQHSEQWIDVNGQIYNLLKDPEADGLSGPPATPGEHDFTVTRRGNRLFAEDETGRYELHGVGCA
jgi:hypothetical protein